MKRGAVSFTILGLAAALLAPPTVWADNQLNCTLKDETGSAIPKGVEVTLKATSGKESGKEFKKKTGDGGTVEFKGLKDGAYELSGNMPGHLLTGNEPIDLAGNEKATCSSTFVSITKINALLSESNEAVKTGKVDLAIEKGKAAVAMAPTIANTHWVLAVAYAKKGMVDEAVSSAKKASEIDKQFEAMQVQVRMEALGSQAGAAMAKQDFDGAIKIYEQIKALAPNEGLVYYNLALAYGHKGQLDLALKSIDKAIELDPQDAEFKQRKDQLQDLYLKSTEKMLVK
jgi:tetratricopeptide (TPR) repeat protein